MIKYNLIFFLGIALFGCTVQPASNDNNTFNAGNSLLPDGIWKGTLHLHRNFANDSGNSTDGQPFSADMRIMVTICDGEGMFWPQIDDEHYYITSAKYHNDSFFGNHLIYYQDASKDRKTQPTWVETQSMLLIEINVKKLRAQWSRSVSNPRLADNNADRDFFEIGIGTLQRTADACPKEMLQEVKNLDKH